MIDWGNPVPITIRSKLVGSTGGNSGGGDGEDSDAIVDVFGVTKLKMRDYLVG